MDAGLGRLRLHRRLTVSAREWEQLDRDPGALYRGTPLPVTRDTPSLPQRGPLLFRLVSG
ncbi:hypothetical protein ACFY0A_01775 [Streptomyces sp. NPDC001698]|uniref:hypothetical protein n=1 Tax=unclassified Streptomyces TaxID=2593676 RepID=UPI003692FF96